MRHTCRKLGVFGAGVLVRPLEKVRFARKSGTSVPGRQELTRGRTSARYFRRSSRDPLPELTPSGRTLHSETQKSAPESQGSKRPKCRSWSRARALLTCYPAGSPHPAISMAFTGYSTVTRCFDRLGRAANCDDLAVSVS